MKSCFLLSRLKEDEFRQWLFYTLRQAFLLWCLAFGVYRYCTARNEVEKARLRRQEPLFLITLVLCLCILIEDIVMILVFDSSFFANADMLPLYISERNFSENILLLTLSFFTLRVAADTLRLRFKEPPSADAPDTQEYVDELLPAFCERYHLTARERNIIPGAFDPRVAEAVANAVAKAARESGVARL